MRVPRHIRLRHSVVTTLVGGCLLLCGNVPAGAFPAATTGRPRLAAPQPSTVTISGKGFGHGVGLSQDGALELGREGKKMPQILGYFYPGTRFGTIGDVTIRAAIAEVDGHQPIDVTLPSGGVVRVGTSGVSVAPGGVARLSHGSDGYDVQLLDPPKNARADTTSANGDAAYSVYSKGLEVVGGASYHGVITVAADGKKLRAIDTLPIETYLDGLGEVRDPSWPAASLQAQIVAARSYAVHSLHPGSLFDVWSDDRSQVYLGASGEYDALSSAVAATRGLVLTYAGSVADTVYSASAGGITATATEGFGDSATVAANEPYLTATRYPTANPLPWSVTYTVASVGAALKYPGTLTGLTVASVGPSGRPTAVTLTGSGGTVVVPGLALYHDLRLQSNLYTLGAVAAGGVPTATIPTGTPDGSAGPALDPGAASGTADPGTADPGTADPGTADPGSSTDPSATSGTTSGGVPGLTGGAAPRVITSDTSAPLDAAPTSSPPVPNASPAIAATGAASPGGTDGPGNPAGPTAGSRPAGGTVSDASRSAPVGSEPAAVKPVAIALWFLAMGTFAGTWLRRRRHLSPGVSSPTGPAGD